MNVLKCLMGVRKHPQPASLDLLPRAETNARLFYTPDDITDRQVTYQESVVSTFSGGDSAGRAGSLPIWHECGQVRLGQARPKAILGAQDVRLVHCPGRGSERIQHSTSDFSHHS